MPDKPTTQESVAAPPKQLDRHSEYAKLGGTTTTSDFTIPGRGFHVNCASGYLWVKCSEDTELKRGYYLQGLDYSRDVINVLADDGQATPAATAFSAAGDVSILV